MIFTIALIFGQLSLPAELRGEVAEFISVIASTEGKVVRFVALDPGLQVFPSALLSNQRATVVTSARPGRYRLLAYTSVADVPTEPVIATVIVGTPAPPAPPKPLPPSDPLIEALAGIYGGSQEANKLETVQRLAALYRAAQSTIQSPQITTTDQLFAAMVLARKNAGVQDTALTALRERIGAEWSNVMGAEDRALTPELRTSATVLAARLATALEALR